MKREVEAMERRAGLAEVRHVYSVADEPDANGNFLLVRSR